MWKAVFTAPPNLFAKCTNHFRSNSRKVYLLNLSSEKKSLVKTFFLTQRTQILTTLPKIQVGSEKAMKAYLYEENFSSKSFPKHL